MRPKSIWELLCSHRSKYLSLNLFEQVVFFNLLTYRPTLFFLCETTHAVQENFNILNSRKKALKWDFLPNLSKHAKVTYNKFHVNKL